MSSSVPYRVAVEKLVQITLYLHFSGLQSRSRNFEDSITYKTVLSGTNSEEEDKLQPNSDPETITHPVQTGWRLHEYNYFSEQQSRQLWFSAAARGGVFRQKGHVVCQLIPRMRTWTDLYCAHSRSSRYPHSLLFDVMVSCHDIFSVLRVGGME